MDAATAQAPHAGVGGANQFLTFRVGGETFAATVASVERVLEVVPIMRVPGAPPFVSGVINMMGRAVPVIDLRLKFGMESTAQTVDTCIVVFEAAAGESARIMGVLVDAVNEVVELAPEAVEPPPQLGSAVDRKFLTGIGKHGDQFMMILDLAAINDMSELALPLDGASAEPSSPERPRGALS